MSGKLTGLGWNFYLDGHDLSGDVNAIGSITQPLDTVDVTGVNKSAHERLGTLAGGSISFTTIADVDAGQEQKVMSPMGRGDRIVSAFAGTVIGNAAMSLVSKQVSYSPTRGTDALLSSVTEAQSNAYPTEWGWQLTAGKRTDTDETDGATFDSGAAGTHGAQIYVQVFAFTGTDCTITIESASDAIFTTPQTEATHVVGTPPEAVRLAGANSSVNRYWRVSTSTTGGFTSVTFAAMTVINRAAVTF